MPKANQNGTFASGIPLILPHIRNIPSSNQVEGKTNILEKHFYLKDGAASNQNSLISTPTPTSISRRRSRNNSICDEKSTSPTEIEIDDLCKVGNEVNSEQKSLKQMTKHSMKRPADERDDTRSSKRENKDQQPSELYEKKQEYSGDGKNQKDSLTPATPSVT
ncbi:hypothetical protein QAD02_019932 [Eretmocerus hayati]|uniref:Uncharacterized protein n=1 Tax=Eretmocerus hayati TaxID=131215 RepID=A0ACC2PL47_9HYME|nr:hypothetical protein QAD02_019932 [Eretmocerus hayati]